MRHFVAIALATSVVAATACTRTQLSSDPSGSRRTGVRFYDPKPYLLVTKRADVPTTPVVKTEVVTLPDLQHAHYLADNFNPTSQGFKVNLVNGMLTSLTVAPDSKSLDAFSNVSAQYDAIIKGLRQRELDRIAFDDKNKPPVTPTPTPTTPATPLPEPTAPLDGLNVMDDPSAQELLAPSAEMLAADDRVLRDVEIRLSAIDQAESQRMSPLVAMPEDASVRSLVATTPPPPIDPTDASAPQVELAKQADDVTTQYRADHPKTRVTNGNEKAHNDALVALRAKSLRVKALATVRLRAQTVWAEIRVTLRYVAGAEWTKKQELKDDLLKRIELHRRSLLSLSFSEDKPVRSMATIAERVLLRAREIVNATPLDPMAPPTCPPCPPTPPAYDATKTPVFYELYEMIIECNGYRLRKVDANEPVMAAFAAMSGKGIPVNNDAPLPPPKPPPGK